MRLTVHPIDIYKRQIPITQAIVTLQLQTGPKFQ